MACTRLFISLDPTENGNNIHWPEKSKETVATGETVSPGQPDDSGLPEMPDQYVRSQTLTPGAPGPVIMWGAGGYPGQSGAILCTIPHSPREHRRCLLKTFAAWIRRAADTQGDHPSSAKDLTSPVHWPTQTKESPALYRFAKDSSDPVKGIAKPPRALSLRLFCYQISACEEPSVDSEC